MIRPVDEANDIKQAFQLAVSAESARLNGSLEQANKLSKQALELAGLTDEENYVEAIESSMLGPMENDQVYIHLETILDVLTKSLSAEHPQVRSTLERLVLRWNSWLSDYYLFLGTVYRRLINLRIAQVGSEQAEVADRLLNYADYLANRNESQEAQNCLIRAVSIRKLRLGLNKSADKSYAQALTRLGCLLSAQRSFETAEVHLAAALEIFDRLESQSSLLAHTLEDLATVYIETDRRVHAEPLLIKAANMLAPHNGRLGSLVDSVIKLGGLYLFWNRLPDACALFDYSMRINAFVPRILPELNSIQTINDTLSQTNNPYLEVFELLRSRYSEADLRRLCRGILVNKYSWAIPSETALKTIAKYAPIVELGSGTGYWASLLRQRDVDVIAYDAQPIETGRNGFSYSYKAKSWTEVLQGTESTAIYHPDRTLLLCWPPEKIDMAYRALTSYTGNRLIYVGEEFGGCTADYTFFEQLRVHWELVESIELPRWQMIRDSVFVYLRKTLSIDLNNSVT